MLLNISKESNLIKNFNLMQDVLDIKVIPVEMNMEISKTDEINNFEKLRKKSDGILVLNLKEKEASTCIINFCSDGKWYPKKRKFRSFKSKIPHYVLRSRNPKIYKDFRNFIKENNIKSLVICGDDNVSDKTHRFLFNLFDYVETSDFIKVNHIRKFNKKANKPIQNMMK